MSALAEALQAFLKEDGWPAVQADETSWVALVEGKSGRWQISFEIRTGEVLVVRSHAPMDTPTDRRGAVAEYAVRATHGLSIGSVELDMDTGRAAVRTGFDAEDVPSEALPTLIKAAAYASAHLADRYLPGLLAVALGALEPVMGLPEDERPSGP